MLIMSLKSSNNQNAMKSSLYAKFTGMLLWIVLDLLQW
jgi:hypothetical protein